jgi:5-methylthioadenosine/S-adenosylhomocysteine deaminase
VSHIVYASGREHVSHVWVGGELRVQEHRLTAIDGDEVMARARLWQQRLAK